MVQLERWERKRKNVRGWWINGVFIHDTEMLKDGMSRWIIGKRHIKKHTETRGSPSKGTRKAAKALEHVFNPPMKGIIIKLVQRELISYQISAQTVWGKHLPWSLYRTIIVQRLLFTAKCMIT